MVALAALSAAAFLAGIWINPPYAFAPEDNLTYRDMIVLHQHAVHFIDQNYPQATVLTAWPATSELTRPELGYTNHPVKTVAIENFAIDQIQKAAADPGSYDTALIFSTKWEPPANASTSASATSPPTQSTSTSTTTSPPPKPQPFFTATSSGRPTAKASGPPSSTSLASSKPTLVHPQTRTKH